MPGITANLKVKCAAVLCTLLLATFSSTSYATVAAFDDAWTDLGQGISPNNYYPNLTISIPGGYGLVGGVGNGDPGNWELNGTNGPALLGLWTGVSTYQFTNFQTSISMDVGTDYGRDRNYTLRAYLGANPVGAPVTAHIVDNNNGNGTWQTLTVTGVGQFDSVQLSEDGNQCCSGVDNIVYDNVAPSQPIPTLTEWGMIILSSLLALAAVFGLRKQA